MAAVVCQLGDPKHGGLPAQAGARQPAGSGRAGIQLRCMSVLKHAVAYSFGAVDSGANAAGCRWLDARHVMLLTAAWSACPHRIDNRARLTSAWPLTSTPRLSWQSCSRCAGRGGARCRCGISADSPHSTSSSAVLQHFITRISYKDRRTLCLITYYTQLPTPPYPTPIHTPIPRRRLSSCCPCWA